MGNIFLTFLGPQFPFQLQGGSAPQGAEEQMKVKALFTPCGALQMGEISTVLACLKYSVSPLPHPASHLP